VQPSYPPLARKAKIEGTIEVLVEVDATGRVAKATALGGSPFLQGAAEDAARKWLFRPATRDGRALPSDFRISIVFDLSGNARR
jgi:protein TonB